MVKYLSIALSENNLFKQNHIQPKIKSILFKESKLERKQPSMEVYMDQKTDQESDHSLCSF